MGDLVSQSSPPLTGVTPVVAQSKAPFWGDFAGRLKHVGFLLKLSYNYLSYLEQNEGWWVSKYLWLFIFLGGNDDPIWLSNINWVETTRKGLGPWGSITNFEQQQVNDRLQCWWSELVVSTTRYFWFFVVVSKRDVKSQQPVQFSPGFVFFLAALQKNKKHSPQWQKKGMWNSRAGMSQYLWTLHWSPEYLPTFAINLCRYIYVPYMDGMGIVFFQTCYPFWL